MRDWYKLNPDKTTSPCDLMEAARVLEQDRTVGKTQVEKSMVSTVFLGLDHQFGFNGPPILFETMVFDGPMDMEQDRYSTWQEAVEGHERMVERVKESYAKSE